MKKVNLIFLLGIQNNKRVKEEESKDVVFVRDGLEQENNQLQYEIEKMKEDLKGMNDLHNEVSFLNSKFDELYSAGIVEKI